MIDLEKLESLVNNEGNAKNFAQLAKGLIGMGIIKYDYYVSDGLYRYYDQYGEVIDLKLNAKPHTIMPDSNKETLAEAIRAAQTGKLSHFDDFCQRASLSGVLYWTTDLEARLVNYYGWGNELMQSEPI
ncbi:MAG TPA: DUF1398 family protein [Lactovum miscens]|uniref:DUF1398 family protein n=1 Tax=Lactovum miscens TaxID=190387 RepID=UPI002EDAD566